MPRASNSKADPAPQAARATDDPYAVDPSHPYAADFQLLAAGDAADMNAARAVLTTLKSERDRELAAIDAKIAEREKKIAQSRATIQAGNAARVRLLAASPRPLRMAVDIARANLMSARTRLASAENSIRPLKGEADALAIRIDRLPLYATQADREREVATWGKALADLKRAQESIEPLKAEIATAEEALAKAESDAIAAIRREAEAA